jgi:hypothetical protein
VAWVAHGTRFIHETTDTKLGCEYSSSMRNIFLPIEFYKA